MANTLGNYNEIFFAQEALIQLESALGIAGRIYRDYSDDTHERGDTINIRKPGTFTVQDAPSVAQDLNTEKTALTLNFWKEVKFKLTDKELTLSATQIVEDHIRPAAYALSNYIDQQLASLYASIPYYTVASNPLVFSDLALARAAMFNRGVPTNDSKRLNGMVDGTYEAYILGLMSQGGMQPNQQDSAIREGAIGTLYKIDWFANQNTPKHTSGVAADAVGATVGITAVGATTMTINGLTAAATFKKGDIIVLAGRTDQYALGADCTTDGTGQGVFTLASPILTQANVGTAGAVPAATVATIFLAGANKTTNLIFHPNFAALGTAKLSTLGAELGGVRMASVAEEKSKLALRSRMYYNGDASSVVVALDILFGFTMLDPALAHRLVQP